jgi:hypothetical protein
VEQLNDLIKELNRKLKSIQALFLWMSYKNKKELNF